MLPRHSSHVQELVASDDHKYILELQVSSNQKVEWGICDEMELKRAKTELNCINREGENQNYQIVPKKSVAALSFTLSPTLQGRSCLFVKSTLLLRRSKVYSVRNCDSAMTLPQYYKKVL